MKARFLNDLGQEADGAKAITPLFTYDKDNKPKFLGTTFFITVEGLLVTAKHCLKVYLSISYYQKGDI